MLRPHCSFKPGDGHARGNNHGTFQVTETAMPAGIRTQRPGGRPARLKLALFIRQMKFRSTDQTGGVGVSVSHHSIFILKYGWQNRKTTHFSLHTSSMTSPSAEGTCLSVWSSVAQNTQHFTAWHERPDFIHVCPALGKHVQISEHAPPAPAQRPEEAARTTVTAAN